jgi:CRP/FNR family cyclic AMP-dependent transcriptional regulator
MDQQLLARVLGKLRFSADLPESMLEGLAAYALLRNFPAGSILFREGAANDELMIISVGRVALDVHMPDRGDVRILSLGPGELLAWSALLADGRMTTSATALEDTQVVVVSANEVANLCGVNRDFGYFFMRRVACALAERLMATRWQLLHLAKDSPNAITLVPKGP